MKIGIILHPFNEHEPAGLGRSILELLRALLAHDRENEYIVYLKDAPQAPLSLPGNPTIAVVGNPTLGFGFKGSPQADVYIFNTPVLPLFFRPKRSILIAHDFAYLRFASHTLQNQCLRIFHGWSLRHTNLIIAVSEKTKEDLVNTFDVPQEKIKVIYWGFPDICALPETTVRVPERFFLSVGVIKERKNTLTILQAFNEFAKKDTQHHLVVAGRGDGSYFQKVKDFVEANKLQDRVHFLGFVSDQQLSFLYRRAAALVFPSLIEGFGFPVLEAFSCGLPVITSRNTSLEEIAGGAALLINPANPQDIAQALYKLSAKQSPERASYIEQGRTRARTFGWEKTAHEYLTTIQNV